jgi:hypothetical protein
MGKQGDIRIKDAIYHFLLSRTPDKITVRDIHLSLNGIGVKASYTAVSKYIEILAAEQKIKQEYLGYKGVIKLVWCEKATN